MCIATAALVAGGLGAATSAAGSIEQGSFQAQVANNNAKLEQINATRAAAAGAAQAQQESLKNASQYGQLRASQAANGVDVNTGSDVNVDAGAREGNVLDTSTVENNAAMQAYGYRVQAQADKAQAQQDTISGYLGAAGGLLSSASSLAFKWGGGVSPIAGQDVAGGVGAGGSDFGQVGAVGYDPGTNATTFYAPGQ